MARFSPDFLTFHHKKYFISVSTITLFLKSMAKLIEYGASKEIWSKVISLLKNALICLKHKVIVIL